MKFVALITRQRVLAGMIVLAAVTTLLGGGVAGGLRALLGPVLAPLGDAGMYLTVGMRANILAAGREGLSVEGQERLRREFETLRGYAAYWKGESEKARAQLNALLEFQKSYGPVKDLPCELIPARVVGEASLPYDQAKWLNVGRENGVAAGEVVLLTDRSKAMPAGLAVVGASSLVGRISSAGAFSAQMQLVTDRRFKTSAQILRIPDPGRPREIRLIEEGSARVEVLTEKNNRPIDVQAAGDGAGGLIVDDVWRYDNVLPGDLVVTAEDTFLPLAVRIGRVEEVRADPKHPERVSVRVRPQADLGSLRDVFIVNSFPERLVRSGSARN